MNLENKVSLIRRLLPSVVLVWLLTTVIVVEGTKRTRGAKVPTTTEPPTDLTRSLTDSSGPPDTDEFNCTAIECASTSPCQSCSCTSERGCVCETLECFDGKTCTEDPVCDDSPGAEEICPFVYNHSWCDDLDDDQDRPPCSSGVCDPSDPNSDPRTGCVYTDSCAPSTDLCVERECVSFINQLESGYICIESTTTCNPPSVCFDSSCDGSTGQCVDEPECEGSITSPATPTYETELGCDPSSGSPVCTANAPPSTTAGFAIPCSVTIDVGALALGESKLFQVDPAETDECTMNTDGNSSLTFATIGASTTSTGPVTLSTPTSTVAALFLIEATSSANSGPTTIRCNCGM